jgi:lipopolysaccharide export system protein LptC
MAEADTSTGRGRHSRTWIMLALVLVAAGVALVVMDRRAAPPVTPIPGPEIEGEPDVFMEGATISQFTPDGALRYRLSASLIRHYERNTLTRLTEPRFTLYQADGPPWRVRARHGILRPASAGREERVTLREDVVLEQMLAGGDRLSLRTEALELYPERQYVETDRDVIIDSHVGRTTASSLQGDLRVGTIHLHSTGEERVRTTVLPEHF